MLKSQLALQRLDLQIRASSPKKVPEPVAKPSLTTRLGVEEVARAAEVASLDTRSSAEEAARTSGQTSLTTRLGVEEAARAAEVASLDTRSAAEEAARAADVAALQADIDQNESDCGRSRRLSLQVRLAAEEVGPSSR